MGYQTDLLPALKDWGLPVIEVNGWRTRGNPSFNPGGAVNHHTAGSTRYSIPSLRILTEGRAGLAGPLCNVGQSRSSNFHPEAEFDDVYLVAAGRANHAGTGSWLNLRGNSSVLGLEIEHCGYLSKEGFSERRQHTAYRIHCAMAEVGGYDVNHVCQHKEWTPRKIDFVGANGPGFRHAVALTMLSKGQGIQIEVNKEEQEMLEEIKNFLTIYLKKDPDPRKWDRDTLKTYNHHLWLLTSGEKNMEELRQAFQEYAGL